MTIKQITNLDWSEPQPLIKVDLSTLISSGVAIIVLDGGRNSRLAVKVIKGISLAFAIRDNKDYELMRSTSDLFVIWAHARHDVIDGIHKYLSECYEPKLKEALSSEGAIDVNLPEYLEQSYRYLLNIKSKQIAYCKD